jgi:hypothetical protein
LQFGTHGTGGHTAAVLMKAANMIRDNEFTPPAERMASGDWS